MDAVMFIRNSVALIVDYKSILDIQRTTAFDIAFMNFNEINFYSVVPFHKLSWSERFVSNKRNLWGYYLIIYKLVETGKENYNVWL